MQSSHFENLQPTEPYLTSFADIQQEQKDFENMDPYFKNHPFTYAFLSYPDNELNQLRKLRKYCNKKFEFQSRPNKSFAELDQFEYQKQLNPSDKLTMETFAQKKYKLVKDYYRFPYDFDQEQNRLHLKINKRKEEEAYQNNFNENIYDTSSDSNPKN